MCCGQYKKVQKIMYAASDATLIHYTGLSQYTIRGKVSGVLYVFDNNNKNTQYVKTNDVEFLTNLRNGIKQLFEIVVQPLQMTPQGDLSGFTEPLATDVALDEQIVLNDAVEVSDVVVVPKRSRKSKQDNVDIA